MFMPSIHIGRVPEAVIGGDAFTRARLPPPPGLWQSAGVLPDGRDCPANEPADRRLQSGNVMPEPPISAGKSFILGRPSRTLSTFSP